jgi:hypothetical protein
MLVELSLIYIYVLFICLLSSDSPNTVQRLTWLLHCTKEQQRSVLRVLWSQGVKTSGVCGRMTVQCGDCCVDQRQSLRMVRNIQRRTDECC